MNYTENYHLPQWFKSDRIMMEDFNQAMANLEEGLIANARTAETLGKNSTTQSKQLTDRILRLAYNQYLAAKSIDPFPEQIGVFYQNPLKDPSGISGDGAWEEALFAGSGTAGLNLETLFATCFQQLTPLKIDLANPANYTPLTVRVRTPAAYRVTNFRLRGNYSNNVPNTPAFFLLTLNNQDTNEVEQTIKLDLTQEGHSDVITRAATPVSLYFHGGTNYILKLEPVEPVYDAEVDFTYSIETQIKGVAGERKPLTAFHTMEEKEDSTMGLLFLQCWAGGPDGRLTVQWDGRTMEPAYVRQVINPKGVPLKEMIFVRKEPIPAKTSFSMRFDCGENGSILFQEWGAILI